MRRSQGTCSTCSAIYFRDASVLILIFVPIEVTIPEYVSHHVINMAVVKWTIGISVATLIAGLGLEYFAEAYSEWRS
jgi:putative effector of murein hydrolase LrgA (UPF0299 family)